MDPSRRVVPDLGAVGRRGGGVADGPNLSSLPRLARGEEAV